MADQDRAHSGEQIAKKGLEVGPVLIARDPERRRMQATAGRQRRLRMHIWDQASRKASSDRNDGGAI